MAKENTDISVNEVIKQINKKSFFPIYLFYGEEKFSIDRAVSLIIEKAIDKNLKQLNVEKYSCNDVDSESIVTSALSIPMLAERKVIIVKDYEKINDSKSLQFYFQHPSQSSILIFIADSIDKRKGIFTKITQNGILVKSDFLKKGDLVNWIVSKVSESGKRIEPQVAEMIFDLKGNSLLEINTEIEKLLTYILDKDSISTEDILVVTGSTKEFNVFELSNAIGRNDKPGALRILENLLDQNVEPLYILAMLSRHFIILWKVSCLKRQTRGMTEIASVVQINPYFVKDYLSQTEKFSTGRIEFCLKLLLEADLLLKSVSLSKRVIVENLLCQMLNPKYRESDSIIFSRQSIEI
jgi:DNA polymerase III subunit delta